MQNKAIRKIGMMLLWLIVWQVLSLVIKNQILLVGPVEVLIRLCSDVMQLSFWKTVLASSIRIMTGFLCAFALGGLFGVFAYRYQFVKELLEPVVLAMKSVPVASFVVILLIWFGSGRLSFWISFLIVFPNLYYQVMEGLGNTDKKLLEVAKVYRMPWHNRVWYLYRPAVMPFVLSGSKVSVGMAWKSGVAAEIIGLPDFSIGEKIYMSKIYLDTAGVLSWTLVCIALSVVFEKIFLMCLLKLKTMKVQMKRVKTPARADEKSMQESPVKRLHVQNLSKAFGTKQVLDNTNLELISGTCYALTEPSGKGKTTLFRILAGLENADTGTIDGKKARQVSMAFQGNRYFPELTAKENLELVCPMQLIPLEESLQKLLPEDALSIPVKQFSGGMARRLEVLRCLLSGADVLLLDEPFNGLDAETKRKTAELMKEYSKDKILLLSSHAADEVALLQATVLKL